MEVGGGLEDTECDAGSLCPIPIARKPPGNDRVVERPDRADMVTDGVVARLGGCHCAHAPAREELITHQVLDADLGLVGVRDPTPEEVPDVGGERVYLAPVAVQCQPEELALGNPIVGIESPLECGGFLLQLLGQRPVVPYLAGQAGAAPPRGVDIAPDLTGGARQL